MGDFYVDDSIHDDAGFIIWACIYDWRKLHKVLLELSIWAVFTK